MTCEGNIIGSVFMVYSVLSSSQLRSQFWWQNWEMRLKESGLNVNATKAAHKFPFPCHQLIPALGSKPGKWRASLSPHQHCDKCATTCSQHLLLRGSVLASEYEVIGHKWVQKKCFIAVRFPARTDGRVRPTATRYMLIQISYSLLFTFFNLNRYLYQIYVYI